MRDYRKPFGLVSKKIPKNKQFTINYSVYDTPTGSYTFKSCNSDLLIDIDNDNAEGVAYALKREKIDVNTLYVIPSWEVPEAGEPQFQTFLHRALWERSENVFKLLLQKGANPRIDGHCGSTVIDDLFGHSAEDILKFGKMLVDAGMTTKEIEKRVDEQELSAKEKPYIQKLIYYAKTRKKRIGHFKMKPSLRSSEHIKD